MICVWASSRCRVASRRTIPQIWPLQLKSTRRSSTMRPMIFCSLIPRQLLGKRIMPFLVRRETVPCSVRLILIMTSSITKRTMKILFRGYSLTWPKVKVWWPALTICRMWSQKPGRLFSSTIRSRSDKSTINRRIKVVWHRFKPQIKNRRDFIRHSRLCPLSQYLLITLKYKRTARRSKMSIMQR